MLAIMFRCVCILPSPRSYKSVYKLLTINKNDGKTQIKSVFIAKTFLLCLLYCHRLKQMLVTLESSESVTAAALNLIFQHCF